MSKYSLKTTNKNTVWHEPTIYRENREAQNSHRSVVLWFTGLSGSGKSTLAYALEDTLHKKGIRTYVMDGDNIRLGLCRDLGFSRNDRAENIRRIGEVSKLFMDAGVLTLTAFISPFRIDRRLVRNLLQQGDFVELFCKASLEVCESRDVKGLYRRARAGEITEFTGISSPYESPENPELVLDTEQDNVQECVHNIVNYLRAQGIVKY